LEAGRDAAYVDTGYLRALLDPREELHPAVEDHWRVTNAVFYTSSLVAAEIVRQLAKASYVDQPWRWNKVASVKTMVVDAREILVCCPPTEVIHDALTALDEMQRALVRLDLCDSVSMVILDRLRHRRVCGFDEHFASIGALLEP
jgi:predicted nucleic acid-binding protein